MEAGISPFPFHSWWKPTSAKSHKFYIPNWQDGVSSKWLHLIHLLETGKFEILISKLKMVRQPHHPEQSRRTISNDQNSKLKNTHEIE